jgi:hypothetical protein
MQWLREREREREREGNGREITGISDLKVWEGDLQFISSDERNRVFEMNHTYICILLN